MDQIYSIEQMLAILLVSFEAQMESIYYLGRHQCRTKLIHQMKKMVIVLKEFIESSEQKFMERIQDSSEEILSTSATFTKAIVAAKRESTHAIPQEFATMAKMSHRELTKELSDEEERIMDEVGKHFVRMKKKVEDLLARIERL